MTYCLFKTVMEVESRANMPTLGFAGGGGGREDQGVGAAVYLVHKKPE